MADQVELQVVLPSGEYLTEKVGCVLLPVINGDVNILPDRAPGIFTFDYGLLQLFDTKGQLQGRYFVKSGMADVAANRCKVMTTGIISYDDVTPYLIKQKLEEVTREDDRLFYEMVLDYQRGARRRYLKRLNVFGIKTGKLRFYHTDKAKEGEK